MSKRPSVRRQSNPLGRSPVEGTRALPRQDYATARRQYERYVELAKASARTDDRVQTENYLQHAEHYFRTMRGFDQQ